MHANPLQFLTPEENYLSWRKGLIPPVRGTRFSTRAGVWIHGVDTGMAERGGVWALRGLQTKNKASPIRVKRWLRERGLWTLFVSYYGGIMAVKSLRACLAETGVARMRYLLRSCYRPTWPSVHRGHILMLKSGSEREKGAFTNDVTCYGVGGSLSLVTKHYQGYTFV